MRFDALDRALTGWMARHGISALRHSLGVVYLWFGVLKFFPGLSPAQRLAEETLAVVTLGLVPAHIAILGLAAWETAIGIGLLFGVYLRATLLLLWLQMAGALMPLILFPSLAFHRFPYAPTMEGQYIIKNLVLISAGIVIGATVRGGRLSAERPVGTTGEHREP